MYDVVAPACAGNTVSLPWNQFVPPAGLLRCVQVQPTGQGGVPPTTSNPSVITAFGRKAELGAGCCVLGGCGDRALCARTGAAAMARTINARLREAERMVFPRSFFGLSRAAWSRRAEHGP